MTSNDGAMVDTALPTIPAASSNALLRSPLLLDIDEDHFGGGKKRAESEVNEEQGEESDIMTPALESPTGFGKATTEWTHTSQSSSPTISTSPAFKRSKQSQSIPRTLNNAATAPAAKSRPLYQDRASSNGNTTSDGASPPTSRDALRRKLMPAIPTRKESFASTAENLPGSSKSSTNIQTLAQAIAARAQHVSAANAMARAGMYPKSASASAAASSSAPPLVSAIKVEADRSAATTSKNPIGEEDGVPASAAALARHAATSRSSGKTKEDASADSLVASLVKNGAKSRDSSSSTYSRDSHRWSKPDSTQVDESTITQGEARDMNSTDDYDSYNTSYTKRSNSSEVSGASTQTTQFEPNPENEPPSSGPTKRYSTQSRNSNTSLEVPSQRLSISKPSKFVKAGLGITEIEDATLAPSSSSNDAGTSIAYYKPSSSQTYVSASEGAQPDVSEVPFPSNDFSSSPPLSTTSSKNSTTRRLSRPSALTLGTSPMVSAKSASTASLAKSLASPVLRSKTPPPTLPPAEPLPPVPTTPSSVYKHRSMSKGSHGSSPRKEGEVESSNPLMAAFTALATLQQSQQRQQQREGGGSEPFDSTISSLPRSSLDGLPRSASVTRRRSLKSSSTSARDAQAARAIAEAMVNANHASTMAGAQSAEAVLRKVAAEPSYNQKRASMTAPLKKRGDASHTSKHISDPTASNSLKAIDHHDATSVPIVPVISQNATANQVSQDVNTRSSDLPRQSADITDDDDDDQFEEAEEAIVTKVLSVNGSTAPPISTATPILLGKDATPRLRSNVIPIVSSLPSSTSAEDVAKLARANSVTKMRALFESRASSASSRGGEGEISTVSRKPIISKANARLEDGPLASVKSPPIESLPVLKNEISPSQAWTQVAATPPLGFRNSVEGNSTLESKSNSPVQSRRYEVEEDHSTESIRIKAKGGSSSRMGNTYGDVATAFKQLQAEKKMLEKVIQSTTPLSGIGNGEDLGQYLVLLTSKVDLSAQEIRRLLDLLDQQRSVMDYMSDTHQLQLNAYESEIEDLNEEIEEVMNESDRHRMNCIRLTEDLDRAHADAIAARAESLRCRSLLAEEESRRQGYEKLLIRAREDIKRATQDKKVGSQNNDRAFGSLLDNVPISLPIKTMSSMQDPIEASEELKSLRLERLTYEQELTMLRSKVESLEMNQMNRGGERQSSISTWTEDKTPVFEDAQGNGRIQSIDHERSIREDRLNPLRSHDEMSTGSLSPLITGPSDVEDALRDRLMQQEKDIAELRAAVALGGGTGTGSTDLATLPSGRADHVQMLLADLAEKRAREAQIRTAYKQLRDEVRKMQLAQQQDRKRASFHYLAGNVSPISSNHGHGITSSGTTSTNAYRASTSGAPSSWLSVGAGLPSDSNGRTSPMTTSSRQLKRLSLPLVTKSFSLSPTNHIIPPIENGNSADVVDNTKRNSIRNSSVDGKRYLGVNRSLSVSTRSERGSDESNSRIPVLSRRSPVPTGEAVESLNSPK